VTTAQLVAALGGGAAAGAVLTAIVTLVTTALNRRHEHRRWLLDKQLEVYVAFNGMATRWGLGHAETSVDEDQMMDDLERLHEEEERLILLAPEGTASKAEEVMDAALDVARVLAGKAACTSSDEDQAAAKKRMSNRQGELLTLQRLDIQGAERKSRIRGRSRLRRGLQPIRRSGDHGNSRRPLLGFQGNPDP
jgi:hypothetical protein